MATAAVPGSTSGVHLRDIIKKYLQWIIFFAIGVVLLFGIKTAVNEYKQKRPADERKSQAPVTCTSFERCTPILRVDGSTEPVTTKEGRSLCFDSSFAKNLPRLGYTAYYKGVEKRPGCMAATCKADSFQFRPEAGVPLPEYWFVPEGSAHC